MDTLRDILDHSVCDKDVAVDEAGIFGRQIERQAHPD
jgi:hypothetical protein